MNEGRMIEIGGEGEREKGYEEEVEGIRVKDDG